ncbi:MAG: glucose-1-phosphate thymidylyltransferase RfbA [Bacilli bacterium]|nr:glucose-1-phosphate thymidylyltransferase RfbA [Bacilli bacterium]MDY6430364.1 glucose-1-phosphate thymidylyltransferase RfbA [Bacilli bacterium]
MKGIILGAGAGSRLYPSTRSTSKLLLPIYDKPMVYYPMATLMEANIREVMLIVSPKDKQKFIELFGDGSQLGMKISYGVQEVPTGIVSAFLIGEEFIGDEPCALVLGDNIFYGKDLVESSLRAVKEAKEGNVTLFGYEVPDPERFGVVEFDDNKKVLSLVEKPANPRSNYAVTGLYFYPSGVSKVSKRVTPSARGEYEITDLNNLYLKEANVSVELLDKSNLWLDTGTFESLLEASNIIKEIEEKTPVAALEIIAYRNGWISKEQLIKAGESMSKNSYGQMLLKEANK